MTRKDYEKFAALFRRVIESDKAHSPDWIYDTLLTGTLEIFIEDNPRFERTQFLRKVYKK